MKYTIIKSAIAVVCVVALCITSWVAVNKYCDSLLDSAKLAGSSSPVTDNTSDDADIPSDDTAGIPSEDVTDIPSDEKTTAAEQNETTAVPDADEGTTAPSADTQKNDPTAYTKDQAVKYYTDSMKKSFNAPKTTIKTTQTIAISVDSMYPKAAEKLAKKIVEAYAKTTESTRSFAKGIATDDGKGKAADHVFPANLDPKGAKAATVTKKGNDYEINILVVPEDATLTKFPVYNRQCSFPLDLGSIDLFGLNITQADFTYEGTKIKATVGADGYVKYAEVYMPLAGAGGGNFIGIKGGAEVSGSMKKTATFSY
ncbi:MAG: hypothetical protein IKJ69_05155 [Clostridia bacterium]|nr:hypothetical protein [Clostridia bacterium]